MTAEPHFEDPGAKAQRLRITFARGPEAADIGHLDQTRVWVNALCDAGLAVSYKRGRRPQPRVTIAAGLPSGATGEAELLEVIAARPEPPAGLAGKLNEGLPRGLKARKVVEVGMGLPTLPTLVRWADYEVDVPAPPGADVGTAISNFLAAVSVPWEDTRGQKTRSYDLRAMVESLAAREACGATVQLEMRLRCSTERVGRADQVVKALGLPEPERVHRVRLILAKESPSRSAWRRRGRYQ